MQYKFLVCANVCRFVTHNADERASVKQCISMSLNTAIYSILHVYNNEVVPVVCPTILFQQILAPAMRKGNKKAWSESEGAVIAALRVCYWLAKEEIASMKYSSLVDLLILQGVTVLKA